MRQLVDSGSGMESANLFTHGPGLLETRPVPDKVDSPLKDVPPDQTATWQDLMMVKNLLGPDQKIAQRKIVLKGQPEGRGPASAAVDRRGRYDRRLAQAQTRGKYLDKECDGQGDNHGCLRSRRQRRHQRSGRQLPDPATARRPRCPPLAPSKNLTARDRLEADFKEAPAHANHRPGNGSQPAAGTSPAAAAAAADTKPGEPEVAAEEKPAEPAWSPWPTASKPTS